MKAIKTIGLRLRAFAKYNLLLFSNLVLLVNFGFDVSETNFLSNALLLLPCYALVGFAAYLLNDFFDRKQDARSGKLNMAELFHPVLILILALVFFAIGFSMVYHISIPAFYILNLQFVLLMLYSLPGVRLKERGFAGVVSDALYAHLVPILVLLALLCEETMPDQKACLLLLMFGFFLGLRDILLHQVDDIEKDRVSGTQTFAVKHLAKAKWLSILFERLAALAIVALLFSFYSLANNALFACAGSILGLCYIWYYMIQGDRLAPKSDILVRGYINVSATSCVILTLQSGMYAAVLLLLHPYFISFLQKASNKIKLAAKYIVKIWIGNLLIRFIPLYVNYLLYYIFRIVGRDLKQKPLYKKENEFAWLKKIRAVFR